MQDISVQLSDQKRLVDFKSYDLSVKELISMGLSIFHQNINENSVGKMTGSHCLLSQSS